MAERRLRDCVERWPEAETGEYNPSCCRFPKSCSASIYSEEHTTEADRTPALARTTEEMRSRFGAAWMTHDDARAVVSAALHDPGDDVIDDAAAALAAKNGRRWSVMAETDREQYREFARVTLDAARAAILGTTTG